MPRSNMHTSMREPHAEPTVQLACTMADLGTYVVYWSRCCGSFHWCCCRALSQAGLHALSQSRTEVQCNATNANCIGGPCCPLPRMCTRESHQARKAVVRQSITQVPHASMHHVCHRRRGKQPAQPSKQSWHSRRTHTHRQWYCPFQSTAERL